VGGLFLLTVSKQDNINKRARLKTSPPRSLTLAKGKVSKLEPGAYSEPVELHGDRSFPARGALKENRSAKEASNYALHSP
jgi:hypothetical protein